MNQSTGASHPHSQIPTEMFKGSQKPRESHLQIRNQGVIIHKAETFKVSAIKRSRSDKKQIRPDTEE